MDAPVSTNLISVGVNQNADTQTIPALSENETLLLINCALDLRFEYNDQDGPFWDLVSSALLLRTGHSFSAVSCQKHAESEVEKRRTRVGHENADRSLLVAIDKWTEFLEAFELGRQQRARVPKRPRALTQDDEHQNGDPVASVKEHLPAEHDAQAHKRQKIAGGAPLLQNALVKLADTVDRPTRLMEEQGQLAEQRPDYDSLLGTIERLENTVERRFDDIERKEAEREMLLEYKPDEDEEREQVTQTWQDLKSKVAKKREMSAWLEDWTITYLKAVRLNAFDFTEDSKEPARDFLVTIKDAYPQFYNDRLALVQSIIEFDMYFFIRLINDFRDALTPTPTVDAQNMSDKCICGTHNKKWKDGCWYLNETARPSQWTPNPEVMNRLHRMANSDRSLKRFMLAHRKPISHHPQPLPSPSPTVYIKSERGPLADSFVLNIGAPSSICNSLGRFFNFIPWDASLPENRVKTPEGPLRVHGTGDIEVFLTAPTGEEKDISVTIRGVKYCPESPMSLIRVKDLCSMGFYFDAGVEMLYTCNPEDKDFAKVGSRNGQYVLEYNPVEDFY